VTEPTLGDRVVLLRGWPGTNGWTAPRPGLPEQPRLWQSAGIVLHAAARLDPDGRVAMPEAHGLTAALVVQGRSVSLGVLVVSDDLAERDPTALRRIRRWAKAHPVATTIGFRAWVVVSLSEFYDPMATIEHHPWAFHPTAYAGAGLVIGADLGRTTALGSEHCGPRRGQRIDEGWEHVDDEWELWLPGVGALGPKGWKRRSPHRPSLHLRPRRVGWQVSFGPTDKGCGKYVGGRPWKGAFVDLLSLSYAFDADRGAGFAEHAEDYGLDLPALPLAVTVDEDGAEEMARAVHAIHDLAL
jgi:hypothetical protein